MFFACWAQTFSVVNVSEATNDLSASTKFRNDLNGKKCGLVKVQCVLNGLTFKGNVVGSVDYKNGEYWVYMTDGSKQLGVQHPKVLPLNIDFAEQLSGNIQMGRTYSVVLSVPDALYGTVVDTSSNYNTSNSEQFRGEDFIETSAGLNMKMIFVEGGDFLMGATPEQGSEGEKDETPVHKVHLDSYYIAECEITQAQWENVMGTNIYQQANKAQNITGYPGVGPDYPMYYVSWEDAQTFCSELSVMTGLKYRLPTEAQWEYAARGGKAGVDTKYSGGGSIDAVAWYSDNSGKTSHPVKGKRPNELGLYDMSGNVWEWCSDWKSNYTSEAVSNPQGGSSGKQRVLRGGGWGSGPKRGRVSRRYYSEPETRSDGFGFRVVVIP